MNRFAYAFYSGGLWTLLLRLAGRVPAGSYVGWGRWMTFRQAQLCTGPGWYELVRRCFDACLHTGVRIDQVKEKFGGLRFYVGAAPDWVLDLIEDCEAESFRTCEECGAPGEPGDRGWIRTLCLRCRFCAPSYE